MLRALRRSLVRGGATPLMCAVARRHQGGGFDDDDGGLLSAVEQQSSDLDLMPTPGQPDVPLTQRLAQQSDVDVQLEALPRPPAQFELMTHTNVFKWPTTAKFARKIAGPLNEWSDEFRCRTGVTVAVEPRYPDKAAAGDYATADDVETNVYFFGAEKAVRDAVPLVKAMVALQPSYVRLAVFRRREAGDGVEWLFLRRINRESRPADIPAISLKTPGKYTMLFENADEAATRTLYEETGIDVDRADMVKTNMFSSPPPQFWWRPPVHYYIAEVPFGVEVLGPQAATRSYMQDWDPRILRQSTDPIDRVWAAQADPATGCAWLQASLADELQKPVKQQDNYMALRYTPPPESGLQSLLGFSS